MADEPQTDATNSAEATQTAASAATDTSSSTTEQADAGNADGLDGASILGDAAAASGAAEGSDGKDAGDTGNSPDANGKGADSGDAGSLLGAPEGDYELTGLPEGTVIDKDALEAVAPVAKELNLSNEGLSKIASVYAEKVLPAVVAKATGDITAQVVAQRAAWDAETRTEISGGKNDKGEAIPADPVYQGKSYDVVTQTAAKAIDRFGGDDFRTFLKDTGLGNNPAMVRFAYQAGALISEDTDFVRAGDVPPAPKSREEKYYGARAG